MRLVDGSSLMGGCPLEGEGDALPHDGDCCGSSRSMGAWALGLPVPARRNVQACKNAAYAKVNSRASVILSKCVAYHVLVSRYIGFRRRYTAGSSVSMTINGMIQCFCQATQYVSVLVSSYTTCY